jgi:hypothetical protein
VWLVAVWSGVGALWLIAVLLVVDMVLRPVPGVAEPDPEPEPPTPPEDQDPSVAHAVMLAAHPTSSVLVSLGRFTIVGRGMPVTVDRDRLTPEQDAYMISRVRR